MTYLVLFVDLDYPGGVGKLTLEKESMESIKVVEYLPSKSQCHPMKSVLYDQIMPSIRPMIRQFKLISDNYFA